LSAPPNSQSGLETAKNEPFEAIEPRSALDYALRTVQQSQVQFSLMADAKANIMLTVCSIVISVSLTQLDRPEVLRPLLTLDFFTTLSLIAALLCVMPSNRRPPRRADGSVDRRGESFNPLFFMHFRHLSLEEFEHELEACLSSPGHLYRSLAKDIYASGTVLAASKYRLMRVSYIAFLTGLFAAGAVFVGQILVG
jgi:hypothetical protein